GLSWLTILRKPENFRVAFAGFNIRTIVPFGKRAVNRLLTDAGIVRHRGTIESKITNWRRAVELAEAFGSLAAYVWQFEPPRQAKSSKLSWGAVAGNPTTSQSIAMSKDLKRRGWSFVGPTTLHAFMQAMGLVNHHVTGCYVRERAEQRRSTLR